METTRDDAAPATDIRQRLAAHARAELAAKLARGASMWVELVVIDDDGSARAVITDVAFGWREALCIARNHREEFRMGRKRSTDRLFIEVSR